MENGKLGNALLNFGLRSLEASLVAKGKHATEISNRDIPSSPFDRPFSPESSGPSSEEGLEQERMWASQSTADFEYNEVTTT